MAYQLLRHIGNITQANDSAALLDLLYLSPGACFRISEFGGEDGFFLISNEGTTVTATNGTYIRANSTVFVFPDIRPKSAALSSATNANPGVLTCDGGHSFVTGENISLFGSASGWNTLITVANVAARTDTTITTDKNSTSTGAIGSTPATIRTNFRISHINETAGSNSKIYVEEVAPAGLVVGN
tara:strand:- start:97 stop:651 length:555 start_codon:yes stop_codon:yes gene_type:complete